MWLLATVLDSAALGYNHHPLQKKIVSSYTGDTNTVVVAWALQGIRERTKGSW